MAEVQWVWGKVIQEANEAMLVVRLRYLDFILSHEKGGRWPPLASSVPVTLASWKEPWLTEIANLYDVRIPSWADFKLPMNCWLKIPPVSL